LLVLSLTLAWGTVRAAHTPPPPDSVEATFFRVIRVYFNTREQLQTLVTTLDVWEVYNAEGYLVAQASAAQQAQLGAEGLRVETDALLSAKSAARQAAGAIQSIPGLQCYRTVEETFSALAGLAAAHPGLAQTIDIGDSWLKHTSGGSQGYDLWLLRLTNAARSGPKARLFVLAEVHARELTTAETALRLAETLLQNYATDADITWLLDYNEIYILPMANPDGRKKAEAGLNWRKNVDPAGGTCSSTTLGVDLNRNSSFHWGGPGASPYPCDLTYHGPGPASEPEVQAIQTYVAGLFADRRGPLDSDPAPSDTEGLLISLHSYGGLVLWPYGWSDSPAPNQADLAALGGKLAYRNGYTPGPASGLYLASGSTDDWAYGELGLAAYTIEMGSSFFESCTNFESTIWPANRAALLYAAKTARRPYQTPSGPEVLAPQVSPVGVPAGTPLLITATVNGTLRQGGTPQPVQGGARLTLDAPAWSAPGLPLALTAADGAFGATVEGVTAGVNTCGLAVGQHSAFLEGQAGGGAWGVLSAVFFSVLPPENGGPLQAASRCQSGAPGAWLWYPITVRNLGSAPTTFNLSAVTTGLAGQAAPAWETGALAPLGPLAVNEMANITLKVRIPAAGTSTGLSAVTRLTLTAAGQPDPLASLALTTTATGWSFWLPNVQK